MNNLNFISDNTDIISPVITGSLLTLVVLFVGMEMMGKHYPKVFLGLFGSLAVVSVIALVLFLVNNEHDNYNDNSTRTMFIGSTLNASVISSVFVAIIYMGLKQNKGDNGMLTVSDTFSDERENLLRDARGYYE